MPGEKSKSKLREAVHEAMEEVVAEEEEALLADRKPGQILDRTKLTARKVPWTRRDITGGYPAVTFTPEETIPITVHGQRWQLISDQVITVPSIIKEIYDEHRRAIRASPRVLVSPAGDTVHVLPGAGGLEPEATREV